MMARKASPKGSAYPSCARSAEREQRRPWRRGRRTQVAAARTPRAIVSPAKTPASARVTRAPPIIAAARAPSVATRVAAAAVIRDRLLYAWSSAVPARYRKVSAATQGTWRSSSGLWNWSSSSGRARSTSDPASAPRTVVKISAWAM